MARNGGEPHDALGFVGIDVGIVEQPEAELVPQEAARRLVDSLLGDAPRVHELDEHLRQLLAAELVAAGLDDLDEPLLDAKLLDAPALRREHRPVRERCVGDEPPVGADDAVEAVALAQEAGDDIAVEAEADLLERCADGPSVVRHDLRRSGRERGFEDAHVVLEHAAGIHLILAVREVRVLAVELRAAAREVLRHAGDRLRPELLALETADVRRDQARGELAVLAERVHDPRPPWFRREVRHRVERDVDADRAVLASRDVAELIGRHPRRRARRSRSARAIARNPWPTTTAAKFSAKLCRGSDEIVTGIPRRVVFARSCSRLCHSACCRGPGAK